MNDDRAFDEALRQALRLAADSVQPAADGLDMIWAKARVRKASQPVRYRLAAAVRRASLAWTEPLGATPRLAWLARASRSAADGFRGDAEQAGRLGWVRPAVAVATALIVVVGAAWAITTLPGVIATSASNAQRFHQPGMTVPPQGQGSPRSAGTGPAGHHVGGGRGGSATPSPSPTCTTGKPAPKISPSPSASTTTSPSPTPSSSGATGSPSPTGSAATTAAGADRTPASPASASHSRTRRASPPPTSPAPGTSGSPRTCGTT